MAENKDNTAKVEISGMSCSNCALGVKKKLEKDGFKNVNVELSFEEATFNYDNEEDIKKAIKSIESLGYKAWTD
ncbi:MAG: heavy metal-associated domain-containing protein, partial [Bacteroidales bacterium]